MSWSYGETLPVYWCFMEPLPPMHFWYMLLLFLCDYVLWGSCIYSYSSISCLNTVRLLLLKSDVRLLLFLGILFFEYFLELLSFEFSQQCDSVLHSHSREMKNTYCPDTTPPQMPTTITSKKLMWQRGPLFSSNDLFGLLITLLFS